MGRHRTNTHETFWDRVDKTDSCWIWTSTVNRLGYGQFTMYGVNNIAHKLSYEMIKGPVAKGLVLDHLCRNPKCVNPEHLEPVTQKINVYRGNGVAACNKLKTHCNKGHKFNDENTGITKEGRRCLKCHAEESNKRYYDVLRNPKTGPRNRDKIACKFGHKFTSSNLLTRSDGKRACKRCYELRKASGYFKR